MTRLRSSTCALRATTKSSVGAAQSAGLRARCALKSVVTTAAAVFIGGGTKLFACPMCFGAQESSLIDGAKLGVLVMLGVLLAVQGAFAYFFLYLRKRARENADIELDLEWSELQRGSRPL